MMLKPRNTVKGIRALLYRRFTNIDASYSNKIYYKTITDGKKWLFNAQTLQFLEFIPTQADYGQSYIIIEVQDMTTVLKYTNKYFRYTGSEWEDITEVPQAVTLLSASFNNIAQYQTNRYYFAGSFDFVTSSSTDQNTTQYIKGNILPINSVNIKHFNDYVNLKPDDLVVVDGKLYSVEAPTIEHKHLPKDYYVYYATLNSII